MDVTLSPTVVFEYPTPRAIAARLLEQTACADPEPYSTLMTGVDATVNALSGVTGQWPGGCDREGIRARLQSASGNAIDQKTGRPASAATSNIWADV